MDVELRVRQLEDRQAIADLRHEYARCLDDHEWRAWTDLFTADAVGEFEGWGRVEGHDELLAFARDAVGGTFDYTAHVMHNPVIELDGDTATGRWLSEIYYARPDKGVAGWRQGRYTDRYRRADGEWKFTYVSHEKLARNVFDYAVVTDEQYGDLFDFGGNVDVE
jgi:3-phenylpropionate/cinnamic acid dioxygenase small subunit